MSKNKNIACIIIIVGALVLLIGIILSQVTDTKKTTTNNNHKPLEVEFCNSINYEEKTGFIVTKYLSSDDSKEMDYVLVKSIEDFYDAAMFFEYNDDETTLDFNNYDYLIYYINDGKYCSRTQKLTNYKLDGNNLNIEFTKSEFNIEECNDEVTYGYGIALEKNKVNLDSLNISITNKEDPYKECYK